MITPSINSLLMEIYVERLKAGMRKLGLSEGRSWAAAKLTEATNATECFGTGTALGFYMPITSRRRWGLPDRRQWPLAEGNGQKGKQPWSVSIQCSGQLGNELYIVAGTTIIEQITSLWALMWAIINAAIKLSLLITSELEYLCSCWV